jgi:hypothetical protein
MTSLEGNAAGCDSVTIHFSTKHVVGFPSRDTLCKQAVVLLKETPIMTRTHATESNPSRPSQVRARQAEKGNGKDRDLSEREREAEERLDEARKAVSNTMHRWPGVTVVAFGALGLLAASLIGVGEVAVAGGAGYLAYRYLHRGKQAAHPVHNS